ncbi:cyclase family protein [Bradyrhizobium diazoefficiens]|nr:cyclase family protein [Bradyrhizobium diazoefficiens]MBR0776053.1 cyclase family protein [Bradyrhizobium diazoefficiens]
MCESPTIKGRTGWRGWSELPSRTIQKADGTWVDLTHPFSAAVPRSAAFPPPKFSYFAQMPERPLNVTQMETIVHMGTHVDAPRHFYADGPGMDEIPIERMTGEGVVIRLETTINEAIGIDDLAAAKPAIEPGDIVAIDTGWSGRWGTPEWNRHPYLSIEAAQWLVDRKVKLVAVDTATPDLPFDLRPKDFGFPVHCALLRDGVLISEQIANLHKLGGRRVEFLFCPLPIEGCDGAPARVLARTIS